MGTTTLVGKRSSDGMFRTFYQDGTDGTWYEVVEREDGTRTNFPMSSYDQFM